MRFRFTPMLVSLAIGGLSACQMTDTQTHAVLEQDDEATMQVVESVLAQAMSLASVTLGPGDLTQTSTISVLPANLGPNEGRSPVVPTLFDLTLIKGSCYVVRRDTAEAFLLEGVACKATGA